MKALHQQTLNEQTLMPKDWLRRRMTRLVHKGQPGPFRPTLTLGDISKWFCVEYALIRQMESGQIHINDKWQVQLSQFFYLFDMGLIELKVDMAKRRKTLARATPSEPPCKVAMPRVDFLATKLKFD